MAELQREIEELESMKKVAELERKLEQLRSEILALKGGKSEDKEA